MAGRLRAALVLRAFGAQWREGGREGSLFGGRGLPDYSKGIHRHLESKAGSTGAEGTACGGVAAEKEVGSRGQN